MMNKKTRNTAIVIIALVAVVIVSLSLLKSRVVNLVEREVEMSIGCQLKYEKLDVKFFHDFPDVYVELQSLVLEKQDLKALTIKEVSASLSLSKVLSNELEITHTLLLEPHVNLNASFFTKEEVAAQVTEPSKQQTQDTPSFSIPTLLVSSVVIENGQFSYLGEDSLLVTLRDINAESKGLFSEENSELNFNVNVAGASYVSKGFSVKELPLSNEMTLTYDREQQLWKFLQNELAIGQVRTSVVGTMSFVNSPSFDLQLSSPNVDVTEILDLIPEAFIGDKSQLKAEGKLALTGFVKGEYKGVDAWPAFGVDFQMSDVWMQYADKQDKIEDVNCMASLSHPDGTSIDSTVMNVSQMEAYASGSFISGSLDILTPVSGVRIKGNVKSEIDFANLKNSLPLQANTLVGQVNTKVSFDGKLADLEQENYKDFQAEGYLKITNYFLKNETLPQGLKVKSAVMDFSPEKITLTNFNGQLGTSYLSLKGYLSNYFAYLFDNKSLKGELTLSSSYLNLNEFLDQEAKKSEAKPKSAPTQSASSSPLVRVPSNLNLILHTNVKHLVVDQMSATNCKGKVTIGNSAVVLDNFSSNALGGQVNVTGQYNTKTLANAFTDLDLKLKEVEVAEAIESFSVLQKMIPETQTTEGKVSADMNFFSTFEKNGQVDMRSVKSAGTITSKGLRVANNTSLNMLANQLKDKRYKDVTTSAFELDYTMEKGKLSLSPFDVTLVDKTVNAGGWYSIDDKIDLKIRTTVKAKEIGGDVSKYIGMVSDVNKPLPVTILLTGSASKPTVNYDTREAINILRKDVSKNLNGDAVKSILKGLFK